MAIRIIIPKALLRSLIENTYAAWQWTDYDESPAEWKWRKKIYEEAVQLLHKHYPDAKVPVPIKVRATTLKAWRAQS